MYKRLLQLLTVLITTVASVPVFAQQPDAARPEYWHYGWDWSWGHMLFGSLTMVLLVGGLVLIIILAVRWIGGSSTDRSAPTDGSSALNILYDRFARGEIDKEEFEERKRVLSD